jgi:hypothetical protein
MFSCQLLSGLWKPCKKGLKFLALKKISAWLDKGLHIGQKQMDVPTWRVFFKIFLLVLHTVG